MGGGAESGLGDGPGSNEPVKRVGKWLWTWLPTCRGSMEATVLVFILDGCGKYEPLGGGGNVGRDIRGCDGNRPSGMDCRCGTLPKSADPGFPIT